VVALAPAGGTAAREEIDEIWGYFARMQPLVKAAAPYAEKIMSTADGRRRATQFMTTNFEHIPAELLAHQLRGAAACPSAAELMDYAREQTLELDAARIECPVRIVWGTADRVLAWPSAAARFREEWLPNADWVELADVGHLPQLDVPVETAELILGLTAR
jgi:pimeloyl-ACP methyl ester carboxylesterase